MQVRFRVELDIPAFVQRRVSDGAANAAVNGDLSLISNAFHLARSQFGAVGLRNPTGPATRLHVDDARVRRLSGQEEAALMAAARVDEAVNSTPIGAVIQFATGSAMRLGEIAGMQWADVDLQSGTVLLTKTKNGEARLVPLWPSLRALLESLGPRPSTGRVWATYDRLQDAWERVRQAAAPQLHRQYHMFGKGAHSIDAGAPCGRATMPIIGPYCRNARPTSRLSRRAARCRRGTRG